MYSLDNGFFITYFYEKGFWHESIVDDLMPVEWNMDKGENIPLFINPVNYGVGPMILEKAWAKKNANYMHWQNKKKNTSKNKMEDILLYLTGFHCNEIIVVNPK